MEQLELFTDARTLFEKLYSLEFLEKGFKAVKRNKGAPGADGVTVEQFGADTGMQLKQLSF